MRWTKFREEVERFLDMKMGTEEILFAAQNQYNARRAGITSAIVIAICIPVGIAGFCLVLTLREKAAERAVAKG